MDGSRRTGMLPALLPVERRQRPRPLLATLAAAVVLTVVLVQAGAVQLAFSLAGLPPGWAIAVLAASLLGSGLDVPVARLRRHEPDVYRVPVRLWGRYILMVPVERPPVTVAVNVGGAVIPVALSVYMLAHTGRWLAAAGTVLAVSLVVHEVAVPLPGVGVVMPALLPAVVAAAVAVLVTPGVDAPAIAYVGATLGTLLGADLGNARWLRRMRGGTVSIGGAGTFDGVFVTGVLAVLMAVLISSYGQLLWG